MDWFIYDRDFRHERVKSSIVNISLLQEYFNTELQSTKSRVTLLIPFTGLLVKTMAFKRLFLKVLN